MIRILVVDDHAIVRRGLIQILADHCDMSVIGEASDAAELFALARTQAWDIAILDVSMPGRGGLEVLKELKTEFPSRPVLILSVHPEDQYAVRAFRAGAAGYLTKDSAPVELVNAIRKAMQGGKYVTPSLAERLAFNLAPDPDRLPHEALSDREYQVLCSIASGKTVTEIAEEMSLSVKTISTYRTRLLEKMSLKNNAELTHYAIQQGLV